MKKKYFAWLLFLGAALLLFWIKSNQRGARDTGYGEPISGELEDWRHLPLTISKHAKCRMDCRKIDFAELNEILQNGKINHSRVRSDHQGQTIPVEGVTGDGQHVRIVFAPKQKETVVVTVIDLETEYKCDCD